MRRKSHVRFGERDGGDRPEQSRYGAPVPTPREVIPSPEDVSLTRALVEAGKMLDIKLLDHLVIGANQYLSLKAKGLGF